MKLDDKGRCRCCGRKPLEYKGRIEPAHKFCPRCDRAYDMKGNQKANFAYDSQNVRRNFESVSKALRVANLI